MQIVIDIPDKDYERIMASNEVEYYELKIAQGIPLPKGHGDLVDRNSITHENTWKEWSPDHGNYFVCTAPTVIEADKGGKK